MSTTTTTHFPQIPVEILSNILSQSWNSDLSAEERIHVLTTYPLVDKTWFNEFTRISMTDVYIPCLSYSDQFLRILRCESELYIVEDTSVPDLLCRSLYFQCSAKNTDMGDMVSTVLTHLTAIPYLPNLRSVTIDAYQNSMPPLRLADLPDQVEVLEITCRPNTLVYPWASNVLIAEVVRGPFDWTLHRMSRSSALAASLDGIKTDAVEVHSRNPGSTIDIFAPLDSFVQAVMGCTPSGVLTRAHMRGMSLEGVLTAGVMQLFSLGDHFFYRGVSNDSSLCRERALIQQVY